MRDAFRLPMTKDQAMEALMVAYQAEVELRRRTFVSDESVKQCIGQFAAFLTEGTDKFGVIFSGTCGNGKTTLLYAFQNYLNYLYEQYVIDKGIIIVDAKELAYSKGKSVELRNEELLAIEDLGREPVDVLDYGNATNPVIDLLEHRYNNQLFTAITTNLTPKQIRDKYGVRMADRFNEMFHGIIFSRRSFR